MEHKLVSLLRQVIEIPSPTGYDREILAFLSDYVKDLGLEFSLTNKGGFLVKIPGKSTLR